MPARQRAGRPHHGSQSSRRKAEGRCTATEMQKQREQSQDVAENKGSMRLEMRNGPQFARRSLRSQREAACSPTMIEMSASVAGKELVLGTGGTAGMEQGNAGRYKNSGNKHKKSLNTKSLLFLEARNELKTNSVFVCFCCVSARKHHHFSQEPGADLPTSRSRERSHGRGLPWRAVSGILSPDFSPTRGGCPGALEGRG